jgi:putative oxidoreductase
MTAEKLSGLLEVLYPYAPVLLVILRVVTGAGLAIHGYPKANGGRVQAGQWMKSMGIPPFTADLATVLEFAGGMLLVVGLLTPVVGLFLVLQFGSITLMKKMKMHAKFINMEQGKPTYEIDVLYLLLALVFLFLGAGPYSLDHLLGL